MTEDDLEKIGIDWFKELGWDYKCPEFGVKNVG